MTKKCAVLLALRAACGLIPLRAAGTVLTMHAALSLKAVAEVAVSPSGQWVAFVVSERDLKG